MNFREKEDGTERIQPATELLRKNGVLPFTIEQERLAAQMAYEEASTLESFTSKLEPRTSRDILIPDINSIVIASGGTNNYLSVYRSTKDNTCIPGSMLDIPIPAMQQSFETTKFSSGKAYYDSIVELLYPALTEIFSQMQIDALGFVYSNRGRARRQGTTVDILPDENMTKNFVAPGISREPAGLGMIHALQRRKFPISTDIPFVVGNDGALLALGYPDAQIAVIDGTGLNISVIEHRANGVAVCVKEAGDYLRNFPLSTIETEMNNAQGAMRGRYKAEAIAGGISIQHQMNRIISLFHRNGLLHPLTIKGPLSGPQISQLLAHETPTQGLDQYFGNYSINDTVTWEILRQAAEVIRDRAASVIKTITVGIIAAHPESFQSPTITCTLEGSTILYTPGLMNVVSNYLREKFPQKQFNFISSSSVDGAGFAAIRAYTQQRG